MFVAMFVASTRKERLRRVEEALSRGRSASTRKERLRRIEAARSRRRSATVQPPRQLRASLSLRSLGDSTSLL